MYMMLPSLSYYKGNIKGIIMMFPSQYEGIAAGSIFTIKDGSFDCGIY